MTRQVYLGIWFVLSSVPDQVHPEGAKVELVPLGEVEVQSIVSKTFEGVKEMEKLTSTLVLIAQGNPRRMNELLSVLHSEGWLTWKRGWVYEPGKDEKGLAARLEGWLGARIEGLDDDAREILSLFSVAESSLPLEVITRVQGESASLILTV
jgi:predicted ATPase